MRRLFLTLLTLQCTWRALGEREFEPYHVKDSIITFPSPAEKDAYFGFSVATFKMDEDKLKIVASAPRDGRVGKLFDCNIDNSICTIIEEPEYLVSKAGDIVKSQYVHHKFWLGATVKGFNGTFFACAPIVLRPTVCSAKASVTSYATYGHCFKYGKDYQPTQLNDIPDKERTEGGYSIESCMDSFGWSIDISGYGNVLVGGPAMTVGRVMLYNNEKPTPNLIVNKAQKDGIVKFNFGYSVVHGNFFDDNPLNAVAMSSPFGEDGVGKVLLLRLNKWIVIKDPSEKVGSLFGAALCSAKLKSGSNRAYLLVGSPGFGNRTSSDYNRGAVHVYVPGKGKSLSKHRTIIGRDKNSFFGLAMANVGRLDGDESDDVAIAAPFEDEGRGAIYIYLGSDLIGKSENVNFKQRIAPEGFRAFGLSLSALIETEYNISKELIVGAPGSMMKGTDKVAVVHSMGWIRILLRNEYPDLQLKENTASFTFQSCMDVTYSKKLISVNTTMNVTVNIIHPSATLDNKRHQMTYTVPIIKMENNFCTSIRVLKPEDGQYDIKIGVKVTAVQSEDPSKFDFNSTHPVLCASSNLDVYDTKFAGNCKNEKCTPNLKAEIISTFFTTKNYTIGSTELESFKINVTNTNEAAYSPCVIVTVGGVPIESVPLPYCQDDCGGEPNCRRILCRPKSPIFNGKTWEIDDIVLKTSMLNSADKNITVEVVVRNECSNESDTKVALRELVNLTSDLTGVNVHGITNGGEVVALKQEQVKSSGAYFEHVYTVSNLGPTNLGDTRYEFSIKKYNNLSEVALKVQKNLLPFTDCDQQFKEDGDMFVAVCEVDEIKKGEKLEFTLPIHLDYGDWYDLLKKEDIIIKSELKMFTNVTVNKEWNVSVSTTLTEVKGVPWWVILLAIIIGLILLGAAIYYLNKRGIFKRKNKANLKELQREVRRQTLRRSLRESSSARNEFSDKNALCDSKEQTEVENEIDILEEVNDGGQRPGRSVADVHREGRDSLHNTRN